MRKAIARIARRWVGRAGVRSESARAETVWMQPLERHGDADAPPRQVLTVGLNHSAGLTLINEGKGWSFSCWDVGPFDPLPPVEQQDLQRRFASPSAAAAFFGARYVESHSATLQ